MLTTPSHDAASWLYTSSGRPVMILAIQGCLLRKQPIHCYSGSGSLRAMAEISLRVRNVLYRIAICYVKLWLVWCIITLLLLKMHYQIVKSLALCIGELLYKLHTYKLQCYTKLALCSKNCYVFFPNISDPARWLLLGNYSIVFFFLGGGGFTGKIVALFHPDSHIKVVLGCCDLSRYRQWLPPVINIPPWPAVCRYSGPVYPVWGWLNNLWIKRVDQEGKPCLKGEQRHPPCLSKVQLS